MSVIFRQHSEADFEDVFYCLRSSLGRAGFELLTDVELQSEVKERYRSHHRRYVIFASRPETPAGRVVSDPLRDAAHRVPSNVILQEAAGGQVEISAFDPTAALPQSSAHNGHGDSRTDRLVKTLETVLAEVN